MALTAGTRFGSYEIVSPLGAGGMGEVYRATDTKPKRQVALKVLPDTVAGDPERIARFQREAEVLAALNHPHIAAIYGLEEQQGVGALVMEPSCAASSASAICRAMASASATGSPARCPRTSAIHARRVCAPQLFGHGRRPALHHERRPRGVWPAARRRRGPPPDQHRLELGGRVEAARAASVTLARYNHPA